MDGWIYFISDKKQKLIVPLDEISQYSAKIQLKNVWEIFKFTKVLPGRQMVVKRLCVCFATVYIWFMPVKMHMCLCVCFQEGNMHVLCQTCDAKPASHRICGESRLVFCLSQRTPRDTRSPPQRKENAGSRRRKCSQYEEVQARGSDGPVGEMPSQLAWLIQPG